MDSCSNLVEKCFRATGASPPSTELFRTARDALYFLFTEPAEQVKNIPRFKLEIRIMKILDHPNIIKLYEHFEDHKNIYLVMELCTVSLPRSRILLSKAQAFLR